LAQYAVIAGAALIIAAPVARIIHVGGVAPTLSIAWLGTSFAVPRVLGTLLPGVPGWQSSGRRVERAWLAAIALAAGARRLPAAGMTGATAAAIVIVPTRRCCARGTIALVASIVMRATIVASSATILLASRCIRLARRLAGANLVTEVLRYPLPHAVAEAVHLLFLKRTVALFLSKESLKIFGQALDGLVGKLFCTRDELVTIGLVVCHIIPLGCERLGRLCDLAGGKKLGDAQHLFKSVRVRSRWSKEVFFYDMVTSGCHVNILKVSQLLIVEDLLDKKVDREVEVGFDLVVSLGRGNNCFGLERLGEVVV
jgi:hypothetical protein